MQLELTNYSRGWKNLPLMKICNPKQWPTISMAQLTLEGYPVYGANGIIGSYPEYNHDESTILITCRGATCGEMLISSGKCWVNGNAMALDNLATNVAHLRWLFYSLKHRGFKDVISGSAQPQITRSDLASVYIPLPPLPEQARIAARLDLLLGRLKAARKRLDAVPELLKRFRKSVLAMAVSGRLTEEWRAEQELSSDWKSATLGEIAEVIGGITKDSSRQSEEGEDLPYLRVANVQRGYLDLEEIKLIRIPKAKVASLLLIKGDILFTEGGDLDKLGRGWVWEDQLQRCSFQNHIFRARLRDKYNVPKYISIWGNTEGLEYFLRKGKQTTNLASINRRMLIALPISLPNPREQREIVRRVDELFAYADVLEARVAAARKLAERLEPSILAKAFRGELSEQIPEEALAWEKTLADLEAAAGALGQKVTKRGRKPRAHAAEGGEAAERATLAVETLPRKQGRPPKIEVQADAPKRPRGRPRKV